MKKKLPSLLLAMLLLLSLLLPVSAATGAPEHIRMNVSSLRMNEGEFRQLVIRFTPEGTSAPCRWSSKNTRVATVDQTGLVTAESPGSTTIYATANDMTVTCSVTVRPSGSVDIDEMQMSMSQMTLRPGQNRTLWVRTLPVYHTNHNLIWTSSNPRVAGVDGDGTVYGVDPGTAVITATSRNGKTATCSVTVSNSLIRDGSTSLDLEDEPPRVGGSRHASTGSEQAQAVTKHFTQFFANPLAVLDCSQTNTFGQAAQFTAMVELGDAQASNLRFYLYDPGSNQYSPLTVSNVQLQGSTLAFSTVTGGIIVVSDGELLRK